MYNKVTRGERILSDLVGRHGLSQSGKDFLIASLDPMHDNPLKNLEGWPDVESTPSVVRQVKGTMTIANTVNPGGSWDLHICVWPHQQPVTFNQTISRVDNIILDTDGTKAPYIGGVQCFQTLPNAALDIQNNPSNVLFPDPIFQSGAGRLIGLGLEVHDITSDLNRQGACMVWRQSESTIFPTESWTALDVSNGVPGTHAPTTFAVHKIRYPPSTLAEAKLLPGTMQWESEKGCYLVAPFGGPSNPVQLPGYECPLIENPNSDESMIAPNTANVWRQSFQPTAATAPYAQTPNKIAPIHQIGAIFSGLNDKSNFTVDVTWFIESFPTADEKDIVTLATPSATFDPLALEIFSKCLSELPVGVPANWNGLGDWFADVVSEVGSFLSPVLTAVNPGLGALSGAATAAANAYKNNAVVKQQQQNKIENLQQKQETRNTKQKRKQRKNNNKQLNNNKNVTSKPLPRLP